jgi:Ca2+-binding EF-hand superfamily protein
MLTVETSTRLAELFWAIIDGERQVEITRQVLAEQALFSPNVAFHELDKFSNGYLTSADLVEFFRKSNVEVGDREGYLLLRACDSNCDGRLSYSDFTYMVLPDSLRHRDLVKARCMEERMTPEVSYGLVRVFERELEYLRDIEAKKEATILRPDFNLLDAFRRVDQQDDSWLTKDSIKKFLISTGLAPSNDDIEGFMRRVDKDRDDKVTYLEFVDCVLPAEPYCQGQASLSSSSALSNSSKPTVELQTPPCDESRDSLYNRPPSSDQVAFSSPLKSRGSVGQSLYEQTKSTMRSSPSFSPLKANISQRTNCTTSSPVKPLQDLSIKLSPLRSTTDSTRRLSPGKSLWLDRQASPLVSKSRHIPSPLRALSPMNVSELRLSPKLTPRPRQRSTLTPHRSPLTPHRSALTPHRSPLTPHRSSITPHRSPLRAQPRAATKSRSPLRSSVQSSSLQELLKCFTSQITLDKHLEAVRQELSLRSDFNLPDAFRMFDTSNKGSIQVTDVAETLRYLALHPASDDIYTWFGRFDNDFDGRLGYRDFCKMFTPRQHEYVKLLEERFPRNVAASRRRLVFSPETQALVRKAVGLHIEVEVSVEALRQRLTDDPDFDPRVAFGELDLDHNGYVTYRVLKEALQNRGMYPTERELISLFDRYDRDSDGRISYADFIQEVSPRGTA